MSKTVLLTNAGWRKRTDQWIKNFRADQYWVKEDSRRWSNHSVLSLIWWEDESQLIDQENLEQESGSWRSDRKRNWDQERRFQN